MQHLPQISEGQSQYLITNQPGNIVLAGVMNERLIPLQVIQMKFLIFWHFFEKMVMIIAQSILAGQQYLLIMYIGIIILWDSIPECVH